MADDIETSFKANAADFVYYSLTIDETTNLSNTAQIVILMHRVTTEFNIVEEFLALKSMHRTTRGKDLFQTVYSALKDFEQPYEKLSGLAKDGAPYMVARKKDLVALIKNELKKHLLDPNGSMVCHCFIHIENYVHNH